jgi:hypothetical protein
MKSPLGNGKGALQHAPIKTASDPASITAHSREIRTGLSLPVPGNKTRSTAEGRGRKGHSFERLPKEFQRGGFNYRQVAREGDAAIYEQRWTGCPNPAICFEVIRIKRREGFQIDGRFVEPAEVYPASERWGVDGFTVTDRNKAWDKFFEISLEEPARTGREVN